MPRFFRGRSVPDEVAEVAGGSGSALAWGRLATGELVVAALGELIVAGEEPLRVPWDLVEAATWTEPVLTLRFREQPGAPVRGRELRLEESGKLPPAIRERVTQSVVLSRHVPLVGDRGAVFAVRQDAEGATRWTVTFDEGLDPADPSVRARADEALAGIRATLGI